MVRVAQKGCSISILGDTQTWLDMAMSNLLWLTAGSWGGGWTAPFPQANPSPPGIRWLCDAWTCWICMDISVYISIKLQSYYVHHFPVQDLLSLIVGSGEKWGGGRAFPTAVAAGRHNNSDTGYRVLWERQYTVPMTSRKLPHIQESKEKLPRKVSCATGSYCRVSHNCSDAFYQVNNPCRMLSWSNNCLLQPDCSPSPSIWFQDKLSANSTFTEHVSIRDVAGVQQQQKISGSLVLITIRTKINLGFLHLILHKYFEFSDWLSRSLSS